MDKYWLRELGRFSVALTVGGISSIFIVNMIQASYFRFGKDVCAQYREYDDKGMLRGYAKQELLGLAEVEIGCRAASRQVAYKDTRTFIVFLLILLIGPSMGLTYLFIKDDD